jgi:hypothetical protein
MNNMARRAAVILLAAVIALLCGCGGGQEPVEPETPQESYAEVPAEYEDIYYELEDKLDELDGYLAQQWDGARGDTVFSVELVTANSNRGEALLHELTYLSMQPTLQSLKELGVGAITMSVQYPVLNPDFPRSSEYLDFYRRVVADVRSLGLSLIVETTTIFPNPEISPLGVDYAGLTLDEYMREKKAMVETVLRELKPDYLTVENEPMTQQANTGLDFSVANQTAIVNYILSGLNRSGTRIGAGAGSWDDLAYFESLAANTSLDYLDMHIYPIQGDLVIDRAERISQAARSAGKGLAVSEAWLYKVAGSELSAGSTPATAAGIFARDAYSFWIPLDQAFLEVMVELSHYLDMEFLSPFWMQYLFAYLDYNDFTRNLDYAEAQKAEGGSAWTNISAGTPSPTGETYREIITQP